MEHNTVGLSPVSLRAANWVVVCKDLGEGDTVGSPRSENATLTRTKKFVMFGLQQLEILEI